MALRNIIEKGITFSYDDNIRISSAMSSIMTNQGNSTNKKYDYDPDSRKIIMGLDIDWCNAQLNDNTSIQTTSDLMNIIKTLLTKVVKLEKQVHDLQVNSGQVILPETEYTGIFDEIDDNNLIESIVSIVENLPQSKPEEPELIDMTGETQPTMKYLIYPIEWEIFDDELDTLIYPKIYDENGFEMGVSWHGDEDSSIVEYNGINYRILDIVLGQGNYIIEYSNV